MLVGGLSPTAGVVASEIDEAKTVESTNSADGVKYGTYEFTNKEFFETAKNMGYAVEEPTNNPNYDPNEVNTIVIDTTASSGIAFRSSILDQTTATISSSVLNTIKDLGVVAGTALLALHVPDWSVASSVASYIGTKAEIKSDLQVTMVHQRTMNGSQWVVTGYKWV